jgi:hypothetical protein
MGAEGVGVQEGGGEGAGGAFAFGAGYVDCVEGESLMGRLVVGWGRRRITHIISNDLQPLLHTL